MKAAPLLHQQQCCSTRPKQMAISIQMLCQKGKKSHLQGKVYRQLRTERGRISLYTDETPNWLLNWSDLKLDKQKPH